MIIKNIDDVKSSINRSVIAIFLTVFSFSVALLFVLYGQFSEKEKRFNVQQLDSAINLYKSNLSEKLSIVASSVTFIDYLRSGLETRRRLYPEFLSQLVLLKSESVVGMKILNHVGKVIFNSGYDSYPHITLSLCYLGQVLDPRIGNCRDSWVLYFSPKKISREIMTINPEISVSEKVVSVDILNGPIFGSFNVKESSGLDLKMAVTNRRNHFYLYYFLFTFVSFLVFAIWNWYRISSLLNRYIANPVQRLAISLQSNEPISEDSDKISEIQYLTNQIEQWKARLAKIQEQEKAVSMGLLAAQLAHDIRSPLSVMEISLGILELDVPKESMVMIRSAIQSVRDIANDLLLRYRNSTADNESDGFTSVLSETSTDSGVRSVFLCPLIEEIVLQKNQEWHDRRCNLTVTFSYEDSLIKVDVAPNEIRRMVSNLLNNAFEACENDATIRITFIRATETIDLIISDNGVGISEDKIEYYLQGASSKHAGNGIGLSSAVGFMERLGGKLILNSNHGVGTSVTLKFPVSQLHEVNGYTNLYK